VAPPQVLVPDLVFPESVRWHGDRLWFSDWRAGKVLAVDPDGRLELMTSVEDFPFCFDWLSDRLVIVSGRRGKLLRQESDGAVRPWVDLAALSPHPWTEIVVSGEHTYVNNIGFDFPGSSYAPGIIALVRPDGAVHPVADGVAFPNGMVVTPDGKTLIVAESYGEKLTAFRIEPSGELSRRRVWAEVDGHPDGLCLDASGALWYADVGAQTCTRVAEGGKVLETITLDRGCFDCALGGPDGKTLFLAASQWTGAAPSSTGRTGQILTARVLVPGVA